jgi:hypothetical protein
LDNIRAFYDSVVSRAGAFQLRWNGAKRSNKVDRKKHIWSSSLYGNQRNVPVYLKRFSLNTMLSEVEMDYVGMLKKIKKMALKAETKIENQYYSVQ